MKRRGVVDGERTQHLVRAAAQRPFRATAQRARAAVGSAPRFTDPGEGDGRELSARDPRASRAIPSNSAARSPRVVSPGPGSDGAGPGREVSRFIPINSPLPASQQTGYCRLCVLPGRWRLGHMIPPVKANAVANPQDAASADQDAFGSWHPGLASRMPREWLGSRLYSVPRTFLATSQPSRSSPVSPGCRVASWSRFDPSGSLCTSS